MASLTRKLIRGRPYYYLRECKRINGKPRVVWTYYLGSMERLLERLARPEPAEVSVTEFGASAAVLDIATKLGVVDIIDRHVPKRDSRGPTVGQYLLLAALNRCIEPKSKRQLGKWYETTALRRLFPLTASQLTSQRFWDNMNRVSPEAIIAIERELAERAVATFGLDLKCLLFDATNFFTFIDSFNSRPGLAQRGHSKEGRENLRIVGLALLVTSDGDVPLLHHTYAGNQHDSETFHEVINEIATRCSMLSQGVSDITLVFDKGNNSRVNLETVAELQECPFHFVGSLVPTQHAELLSFEPRKMRRLDPKVLPGVRAVRTKKEVFGVSRTVIIAFNKKLFTAQEKTLKREIARRKRLLDGVKESLHAYRLRPRGKAPTVAGVEKRIEAILAGRHMKDLFKTSVSPGKNSLPRFTFRFSDAAWSRLRRTLLGKTVLFTDRADWSDEQIVLAYRSQHHVEADFRLMKNPHFLTFRPSFHWTDQKLRVHAFYTVVALMLLNLLRRSLDQKGISLSISAVMDALGDIREVTLLYPAPPREKNFFARTTLSAMDDVQKRLFDALHLERFSVAETKRGH